MTGASEGTRGVEVVTWGQHPEADACGSLMDRLETWVPRSGGGGHGRLPMDNQPDHQTRTPCRQPHTLCSPPRLTASAPGLPRDLP